MIACAQTRGSHRSEKDRCAVAVQKPRREPCGYTGGCTETEDICMPMQWARLFLILYAVHTRRCGRANEQTTPKHTHPLERENARPLDLVTRSRRQRTSINDISRRPVGRPRVLNPCCCKHSLRILPVSLQTRSLHKLLTTPRPKTLTSTLAQRASARS